MGIEILTFHTFPIKNGDVPVRYVSHYQGVYTIGPKSSPEGPTQDHPSAGNARRSDASGLKVLESHNHYLEQT